MTQTLELGTARSASPGPTGALRRGVGEHRLAVFVVLSCLFSWSVILVLGDPLGSGPFFAAVIVLALAEGRTGLRWLFSRMIRWRVGLKWYLAAILLPAGAAVVAALVTVALGAPAPTAAELAPWTNIVPFFLFAMLVPLLGPWEEPGFRGLALSELLRRWSPLVAGLLVGVIHVFWHFPLFLRGEIPAADVVLIMAGAVVFAWLVVRTGSILLAMVMHATNNAVSGEYISQMFHGQDADTLGWARALIWCGFALAVVLLAGRDFRSAPRSGPRHTTTESAAG